MTAIEIIRGYAKLTEPTAEDKTRAIVAHKTLRTDKNYWTSVEGKFMREVDNVCPDLMLRSMYRRQINVSLP
jgi:hypothetical protein